MKYRLLLVIALLTCTVPVSVNAQSPRYARVISQSANLRDAPSVTGVSTQEITEDTLVKVLDEKLPWYVVRVGNRVGWMHGDTLEFINTGTSTPRQESVAPSTPRVSSGQAHRAITPETPAPAPSSSTQRGYIRGPRGGCYYYSASGRKVYVDRALCN